MSVKRYSVWQDEMFDEKHALNPKNSMVHLMVMHDDYAALEARFAALAAENAGLKQFPDQIIGFIGKLGSSEIGSETKEKIEAAAKKIKTPATDASLNEFLAHGVELFAESQKEYARKNRDELDSMTRAAYCGSAVDAERFAAQLRKGGEHDERQSFLSDEDRHAFVKAFTKGAAQ
ncbi:TPA: hypothetical protein ACH2I9_002403 [Enterobacter asburiae]